jgi:hypothetical protein
VCVLGPLARRVAVSGLIVFHFGGIAMAGMMPPPTPWVVSEIYGRVYRPYLEFLYLTNAYHFYAPDPGPSNFLFAYVEYRGPGGHHWRWVKVPDIDEQGRHSYVADLSYQRRLALLDNARGFAKLPDELVLDEMGRVIPNPIYFWRAVYSQSPPRMDTAAVGLFTTGTLGLAGSPDGQGPLLAVTALHPGRVELSWPRPRIIVPFHPDGEYKPWPTQYQPLSLYGRRMTALYASHLCSLKDPDHPEDEGVSVKVYRAVHRIAPSASVASNTLDPTFPSTFVPYYQGHYDREGNLLDAPEFNGKGELTKGDPLVYWLVPILHDTRDPLDTRPAVYNWMRKHAGDPRWYRPPGGTGWEEHASPLERQGGQYIFRPR